MAGSSILGRHRRIWRLLGAAVLTLGAAGSVAASPAQAGTGPSHVFSTATSSAGRAGPRLWRPGPSGPLRSLRFRAAPAGPAAGPSPAAGAGSSAWQTQPTPNPGRQANGSVFGISCTSASACTAVGTYYNRAGVLVTLAEHWSGSGWAIQRTPNPAGAGDSQLTSVSCASARACTAAGYDTDASGTIVPLIEVWNGRAWRIQATRTPSSAIASGFFGVSCSTAGACTATGDYTTAAGAALPLAERWNGSGWRVQAVPVPSGASASGLFAVSCPAAASCTAVGATSTSSGSTTALAERWNGRAWLVTTTPARVTSGQFDGVSCTGVAACTAVGYDDSSGTPAALAERWNGTKWTFQPVPAPAGSAGSELAAVWCVSARDCTAAGAYADASTRSTATLAETWHGSTWKVQATPNPGRTTGSQFNGISCPTAMFCIAAGEFANPAGTSLPLAAARQAGSWALRPPARPHGSKGGLLNGVSCPAATSCTAVGFYNKTSQGSVPLAESWNGTRWRIQPTPAPATAVTSVLLAVSCPSTAACTAVGYYYLHPRGPAVTLAEIWRGSAWHVQPTANPAGARYSSLTAVSCTSAAACTAVGSYNGKGGAPRALAERWNGRHWAIQGLAKPAGATTSAVSGVSCTSARACVASGYYDSSSGEAVPLIEVWNGTAWHIQHVPQPAGSQGAMLTAVSCTAANACTATGGYFANPGGSLAERWNGTAWAVQATPNPPDAGASTSEITFNTVACASAHACVATGNYTPDHRPATFAAAWNGTAWHLRAIGFPPGNIGAQLYGAFCSATRCTAVGMHFGSSDVSVTLAVGASA